MVAADGSKIEKRRVGEPILGDTPPPGGHGLNPEQKPKHAENVIINSFPIVRGESGEVSPDPTGPPEADIAGAPDEQVDATAPANPADPVAATDQRAPDKAQVTAPPESADTVRPGDPLPKPEQKAAASDDKSPGRSAAWAVAGEFLARTAKEYQQQRDAYNGKPSLVQSAKAAALRLLVERFGGADSSALKEKAGAPRTDDKPVVAESPENSTEAALDKDDTTPGPPDEGFVPAAPGDPVVASQENRSVTELLAAVATRQQEAADLTASAAADFKNAPQSRDAKQRFDAAVKHEAKVSQEAAKDLARLEKTAAGQFTRAQAELRTFTDNSPQFHAQFSRDFLPTAEQMVRNEFADQGKPFDPKSQAVQERVATITGEHAARAYQAGYDIRRAALISAVNDHADAGSAFRRSQG